MLFFESLFSVIYRFYVSVFKEKEIPHYFAGIGSAFFIVNIYDNVMTLLFLYTRNEWFRELSAISKYLSLGMAVLSIPYVSRNGRYKKILKEINSLSLTKRRLFMWLNIVFMVGSITLNLRLSDYVRAINLGYTVHPLVRNNE